MNIFHFLTTCKHVGGDPNAQYLLQDKTIFITTIVFARHIFSPRCPLRVHGIPTRHVNCHSIKLKTYTSSSALHWHQQRTVEVSAQGAPHRGNPNPQLPMDYLFFSSRVFDISGRYNPFSSSNTVRISFCSILNLSLLIS